jgi:hypothetical protein
MLLRISWRRLSALKIPQYTSLAALDRFHFQAILENFVVGVCGASSKRKRLFRELLAIRLELSSGSPEIETGLATSRSRRILGQRLRLRFCASLVLVSLLILACVRERVPSVDTRAPQRLVQDATVADADAASEGNVASVADASQPSVDATVAAIAYGPSRTHGLVPCTIRKTPYFIATEDQLTSYVDKNDWLALVNRSPVGTLAPDDLPTDLVDLRTLEPASSASCEARPCLRKEAAIAVKELLQEMSRRGFPGIVESPYRSYINQCLTFRRWAEDGFCGATEQSALPGHSQHQLGTTVDLFTAKWKKDGNGNVFRQGFGMRSGLCFPIQFILRTSARTSRARHARIAQRASTRSPATRTRPGTCATLVRRTPWRFTRLRRSSARSRWKGGFVLAKALAATVT